MSDLKPPKLVECPRDAMQGIHDFIPTSKKIEYLNTLLKVGFAELDFGSFVSPKAIPQLQDTAEVLDALEPTATELLAIVANQRGAGSACLYPQISSLGYPFSVSETFQMRNTNKSIEESFDDVKAILDLVSKHSKKLVLYLSMGFGNPYQDPYSPQVVVDWLGRLIEIGGNNFSLADTVGTSTAESIASLSVATRDAFPGVTLGLHLHSNAADAEAKISAALLANVDRLDMALLGIGGCPMAADELTGNIDTRLVLKKMLQLGMSTGIDQEKLTIATEMANQIFATYV